MKRAALLLRNAAFAALATLGLGVVGYAVESGLQRHPSVVRSAIADAHKGALVGVALAAPALAQEPARARGKQIKQYSPLGGQVTTNAFLR
jgi:hypothetical protein